MMSNAADEVRTGAAWRKHGPLGSRGDQRVKTYVELEPDRLALTRTVRGNAKRCSASQTKLEHYVTGLNRPIQSSHMKLLAKQT